MVKDKWFIDEINESKFPCCYLKRIWESGLGERKLCSYVDALLILKKQQNN